MRAINVADKLSDRLALTANEICSMTGVGRNTIYNAIAAGELKAKRIGLKKFVVSVEEVKRWLAE
jgi:excisionase family DNA binding protein